jgi:hypothetical protein
MNKNQKKADLIYFLTLKYGSEYRTGVKTPNSLHNAQVKYLLDSRYCWEVEYGIDCNIPYLFGSKKGVYAQSIVRYSLAF